MKKTRKAFTLVELLVVIAILAVLATVGIVGYTSFTKKAKESNDKSVVAQINLALQASEVTDGKPQTMYEALQVVEGAGFVVANLTPDTDGYDYVYDMKNNRFALMNKTTVVAEASDKSFEDGVNAWQFIGAGQTLSTSRSNYLKDGWSGAIAEVKTGLDCGNNNGITSITYNGSASGQSVVIRTSGAFTQLTIDAAKDEVYHYGSANVVNITAVAKNSYYENGSVSELNVKAGKVEVQKNAFVGKIAVDKDATSETVVIQNQGTVFATQVITYNADSFSHTEVENPTAEQSAIVNTVTTVSAEDTIKIGNAEALINLASAHSNGVTSKVLKIELTADIDLTGKEWIPFGASTTNTFSGSFDGKGHKIIGLSNKYTDSSKLPQFIPTSSGVSGSVFGLIAQACFDSNTSLIIKDLTLENVDIEGDDLKGAAGLIGLFGDSVLGSNKTCANVSLTIQNCKVSGKVVGKDKVAGFVGASSHNNYIEGHTLSFVNCTNSATVEAKSGSARAAGFIAQFGDGQNDTKHTTASSLTFDSCVNTGNITSSGTSKQWTGALIAHTNLSNSGNTKVTVVINSNCSNTGTIFNASDPSRVSILEVLGN